MRPCAHLYEEPMTEDESVRIGGSSLEPPAALMRARGSRPDVEMAPDALP